MASEETEGNTLLLNDAERRDLRERTKEYALGIIQLNALLQKDTVLQVLGRQLLRSGTSVGAKYREAFRSRSSAEFVAKIGDCLKELEETAYWLELLHDGTNQANDKIDHLLDDTDQLLAFFTSIVKKVKSQFSAQ